MKVGRWLFEGWYQEHKEQKIEEAESYMREEAVGCMQVGSEGLKGLKPWGQGQGYGLKEVLKYDEAVRLSKAQRCLQKVL
jgi:hypothetical protein